MMFLKTKFHLVFLLFIICLFGSCEQAPSPQVESATATPKVLADGYEETPDIISFKRSKKDIVENLYKEAMNNSEELAKLDQQIKDLIRLKGQRIEPYEVFEQVNDNYWNTANAYVNRIVSDTIHRDEVQTLVNTAKSAYQSEIREFEQKLKDISILSTQLERLTNELKVKVSLKMIRNYQRNERPAIEPIEETLQQYQALIEESKRLIQQLEE